MNEMKDSVGGNHGTLVGFDANKPLPFEHSEAMERYYLDCDGEARVDINGNNPLSRGLVTACGKIRGYRWERTITCACGIASLVRCIGRNCKRARAR